MASLTIDSHATSVEHAIEFDGEGYVLRCDGGWWTLTDHSGALACPIGRRGDWIKALADALRHLSARQGTARPRLIEVTKAGTTGAPVLHLIHSRADVDDATTALYGAPALCGSKPKVQWSVPDEARGLNRCSRCADIARR